MYDFVKVFGERNSGTNFLNLMLQGNGVHATILNKENDFLPAEWARGFAEEHREFFVERFLDGLDREEFRRNFGWKHARVGIERLSANPMFGRTLFILLVRNPFNFVSSLHRRPYNLLPGADPDRKRFIRAPLIANERDHLDSVYLRSPVDLWSQKTLAAVEMALTADNAVLVRYEDIVSDTTGFIRRLARTGLDFDHDDIVQVASTKRDPVSFDDYRRKALAFDPEREFDAEDFAFIASQIPPRLLTLVGYDGGRTRLDKTAWNDDRASYLAL